MVAQTVESLAPLHRSYAFPRAILAVFEAIYSRAEDPGWAAAWRTPCSGGVPPGFEELDRLAALPQAAWVAEEESLRLALRLPTSVIRRCLAAPVGLWVLTDRRGFVPMLRNLITGEEQRVVVPDGYKGHGRGECWVARVGRLIEGYPAVMAVPIALIGISEEELRQRLEHRLGPLVDGEGLRRYLAWLGDTERWNADVPRLVIGANEHVWELDGARFLAVQEPAVASAQAELERQVATWVNLVERRAEPASVGRLASEIVAASVALIALTGTHAKVLRPWRFEQLVKQAGQALVEVDDRLRDQVSGSLCGVWAWACLAHADVGGAVAAFAGLPVAMFSPRLAGVPPRLREALPAALRARGRQRGLNGHEAAWLLALCPPAQHIGVALEFPEVGALLVDQAGDDRARLAALDAAQVPAARPPLARCLLRAGEWPALAQFLNPWPEGLRPDELVELADELGQIEAFRDCFRRYRLALSEWFAADEEVLLARRPKTALGQVDVAVYAAARLSGGELLLPGGSTWLSPRLLLTYANLSGGHDPDACREVAYSRLEEAFQLSFLAGRPRPHEIEVASSIASRLRQLSDYEGTTERRTRFVAKWTAHPFAGRVLSEAWI